jgi:hypothetical protein
LYAFKKANEWGYPDVDALLASIDSDQWSEWMIWERDHHISEAKLNAALICTVLANVQRDPKKRPYEIEDFLPQRKREFKTQSPEEMRMALSGIAPVKILKRDNG